MSAQSRRRRRERRTARSTPIWACRTTSRLKEVFEFLALASPPKADRDLAYAEPKNERQTLDVYAPAAGQEPAGRLLDSRRRLATRRQDRRAGQAAGVRGQGLRLRLDQLPLRARRDDQGDGRRRGQGDPLGPRPRQGLRRRSRTRSSSWAIPPGPNWPPWSAPTTAT